MPAQFDRFGVRIPEEGERRTRSYSGPDRHTAENELGFATVHEAMEDFELVGVQWVSETSWIATFEYRSLSEREKHGRPGAQA